MGDAEFIRALDPPTVLALLDALADRDAALARIEAIHRPSTDHHADADRYCLGCWEAGGYDGAPSWPCPTIQAIRPVESR